MSKTAFLFPGQGAQAVGMGKEVCEQLPEAKALFEQASDLLHYDLEKVCFDGPVEQLNSTVHSQPALFVCAAAALLKLKAERPGIVESCQATAGLSLGEYNAVVFAGVMDFETGLQVVQERAVAMQAAADATPSGMASILGLEADALAALCEECRQEGEILQIANRLCRGNIAVSGHRASLDRIIERAPESGAMRAIPLPVAGAFHTSIMDSAVERVARALSDAEMQDARIPVISNVDAAAHRDANEIRSLLPKQVVSPVFWESSIQALLDDGFDAFYEIGSGRVLTSLMKRINRKIPCENISC